MNRKLGVAVVWAPLLALSGCGGSGYGGGGGGNGNSTYTVGGTVTGLNGDSFTIRSGTTELMLLAQARTFTFPPQANQTPYDITIVTQPRFPIQICNVSNGTGTVSGANVTNVSISCAAGLVVIGRVTGLTGSGLVIRNNATDLPIPAAPGDIAAFVFPPQLGGEAYNVSVVTQPSNPAQTCTVSNGTGVLQDRFVTDVVITCVPAMALTSSTTAPDAKNALRTDPTAAVNGSGTSTIKTQVAFSADGNATAVWVQSETNWQDGARVHHVWSNRYVAATNSWEVAEIIGSATHDGVLNSALPQVAYDAGGNALAIWVEHPGEPQARIWWNRFSATSGKWGAAAPIDPSATIQSSAPLLALDTVGNALAVWSSDDPSAGVWSSHYTAAGGTWDAARKISADSALIKGVSALAFDPQGNALALWSQARTGMDIDSEVWANRYTAGQGWSAPRSL